ncbi:MAG: amidase [Ruminococcaceae bacterium]|nr:amidase [Oscillospiraceae bacterium]
MMRYIPYDRAAAVIYARKWALDRNQAYYNFENIGGDCTNFASQCIFTGAGVMNFTPVTGWYYRSASDRTASWTGVEFLYNFLVNNSSIGPHGREVSRQELLPGDIVQLGTREGHFYHSPVITAVTPEILVAAHTYDALDRPLSSYNYQNLRLIHIDGVRIY